MTSKIHELQQREQHLQEQLDQKFGRRQPTECTGSGSSSLTLMRDDSELCSAMLATTGSPCSQPKSPLKNVVKAYLPDNQKTTVCSSMFSYIV